MQTEEPYWLDEAYSAAITKSDIGLAGRGVASAQITKTVIHSFFSSQGKFLDYGGGYGLLVRLLRDAGFDYYRDDKFCENLFAQGFDATMQEGSSATFELVTAFEVFEHLVQPMDEIAKILRFSRNLFFSTTLLPSPSPRPDEWWYYGVEHGQHVSLYTQKSLMHIARHFHLNFYSDGCSLHLLTPKRLSGYQFRAAVRYSSILSLFFTMTKRQKSLLADDFLYLTGRILQ